MKLRHERLAEAIRQIASEHIIRFCQEYDVTTGIISISDVDISSDESYADIYLQSSDKDEEKTLPKILAPLATQIMHDIGKDIAIRRSPKIRFKAQKKTKNNQDILSLINSLDKQYGLSE